MGRVSPQSLLVGELLTDDPVESPTRKHQHLPHDLFAVYKQYKLGTQIIMAWLMKSSFCGCSNTYSLSVRDLIRLGDLAYSKTKRMPESVAFQFRETIRARTYLGRFFKRHTQSLDSGDVDNDAHEFFTQSLEHILHVFSKCSSTSVVFSEETSEMRSPLQENRFGILDTLHRTEESSTMSSPDCHKIVTKSIVQPSLRCEPHIMDDSIGNAAHLLQLAQEVHGLQEIACNSWASAARGEIPSIVAAFTTQVVYTMFQDIEHKFHHSFNLLDPDALHTAFESVQKRMRPSFSEDSDLPFAEFEAIAALQQPWVLLREMKVRDKNTPKNVVDRKERMMNITMPLHTEGRPHAVEGPLAMLVENIQTLISLREPPDTVIQLGTPLYTDISSFYNERNGESFSLRCSFGLRILFETFKTQLRESRTLSQKPNYRIKSLQTAQRAVKAIQEVLDDPTMPCRCPETLALALQCVQEDLQKFTRRMVFDLLFQAPWVASSHSLEIHSVMFFYGVRLVTYRHYVGSVVHVYNVLRALTAMKPIPLLDGLCDKLSGIVFPGCRPHCNFRSSYTRFMGGRLNVHTHRGKQKPATHGHGLHIPHAAARTASGLGMRDAIDDPRFDYKKVSLFHYVKDKNCCFDQHINIQVSKHKQAKQRQDCHAEKNQSCGHSDVPPCCRQVLDLQRAILDEFSGPLPIARINFCAVYLACVKIVTAIANRWHTDGKPALRCLCFVDELLSAADIVQDNAGKVMPSRYPRLWRLCQEVIGDVLGESVVEDFLWPMD